MGVYDDGFKAGYRAGFEAGMDWGPMVPKSRGGGGREPKKRSPKRKASAYSKRYGAAFKRIAPKNKKKNGGWKQGGFARTQKAAHKAAKK